MSRKRPVSTARLLVDGERARHSCKTCLERALPERATIQVTDARGDRTFYCVAHYVPESLSDSQRLDLCACVQAWAHSSRRRPIALKTGRALERRALVERDAAVFGGWRPSEAGLALVKRWEESKTMGLAHAALFDTTFNRGENLR